MMSKIQFSFKTHQRLNILIGCLFIGVLGVLLYFALRPSSELQRQNIIAVHATSPIATNNPSTVDIPQIKSNALVHHSMPVAVATPSTSVHQITMSSTSIRIRETSKAEIQSIGGGNESRSTITGGGTTAHGLHSFYGGSLYIPMSNNAITSVGAKEADDAVSHKMGITKRRKANDGEYPDDPPDPTPDEEDPPLPLGDALWPLLLCAGAFLIIRLARRKRANE